MSAERPAKRLREDDPNKPVPITLLSGFLGAGKTTLLKQLLENKQGLKIGLVVNDVAEINIDSSLVSVKGGGTSAQEDTVELQNGCACCSAAEELLQSIEKLIALSDKRKTRWDHIVIEASGVAEPREVRDNFRNCFESQPEFLQGTMLHTMVTVVDGSTFLTEFEKRNNVEQRPDLGSSEFTDGNRQVVDLMCEQIECADVLIINKMDLVKDSDEAALLKETVSTLNPSASVLTATRGKVDLEKVLAAAGENAICKLDEDGEHRLMVAKAKAAMDREERHSHGHSEGKGHGHHDSGGTCDKEGCEESTHDHGHSQESSHHDHGHSSEVVRVEHSHEGASRETVRFGITSFCYQRRRPFHPHRLMAVIRQLPVKQEELALSEALKKEEGSASGDGAKADVSPMVALIRSKGFVWLSNSHSQMFYWALAGKHFELKQYATWWDSLPREEWPEDESETTEIMRDFEGDTGDRRQELVFIGVKMDRPAIVKLLDGCLLTDSEMNDYKKHWMD